MDGHSALASAVRRVLEPLVGLLLRNGIPHAAFAEWAKQAYVSVAEREGRVTTSRISVVSGLTRKDVARLRNQPSPPDGETAARYHRAARVVTGWARDPRFQGPDSQPRDLPFDGESPSFAEVVRAFSGDMPPRAVLDELLAASSVARTQDGRLRLATPAYLPRGGEVDKLQILGSDVAGLIATIAHNLDAPDGGRFLQRKVFYDNLDPGCLTPLRALATREGQRLLELLDRYMSEHDLDVSRGAGPDREGGRRAGVGIYYFEEPPQEPLP